MDFNENANADSLVQDMQAGNTGYVISVLAMINSEVTTYDGETQAKYYPKFHVVLSHFTSCISNHQQEWDLDSIPVVFCYDTNNCWCYSQYVRCGLILDIDTTLTSLFAISTHSVTYDLTSIIRILGSCTTLDVTLCSLT